MVEYEMYPHHNIYVYVREDLKGKHRDFCLCWDCKKFKPGDREKNCSIANLLYSVCVECGLTTPVFECPEFVRKSCRGCDGTGLFEGTKCINCQGSGEFNG